MLRLASLCNVGVVGGMGADKNLNAVVAPVRTSPSARACFPNIGDPAKRLEMEARNYNQDRLAASTSAIIMTVVIVA